LIFNWLICSYCTKCKFLSI